MDNNDFNNNSYNAPNGGYNNGGYNNGGGSGESPKTLAIVGFVLSFLIPIAGLIVSAIALSKYKQTGETDGKGFATAGLVIGIITMALAVLSVGCTICLGSCAAMMD